MPTIPKFTLRLPKLTTRKVWVGIYSEMTGTVVMIWDNKPSKDKTLGYYCGDYAASVWLDEWEHWFGTVQPFIDAGMINDNGISIPEIDCHQVIQISLTASWNEHGQFIGLNANADN